MTVTRTPLCTVKYCPAPRDPDWHVPICGHGLEGHHHHVIKRSQGGRDGPQVFICPECHDNIDNGEWGNAVHEIPGRGLVYWAWDLHGNTLIEKEVMPDAARTGTKPNIDQREVGRDGQVLSAAAEGEPVKGEEQAKVATSAAAPGAGQSKEESDGESETRNRNRDASSASDSASDIRNLGVLTHEQRVAKAQEIKNAEWNRQWIAGDTGNQWIEELGESAEQYLSDFGYVHESLANILRVCAAIPPPYRNGNLRFSHHVVVYDQPPEDRMRWLAECEEEQWSVAEFRRQVKGTKPRVKRYSPHEIHELANEYPYEPARDEICDFADWLGERDEEQA